MSKFDKMMKIASALQNPAQDMEKEAADEKALAVKMLQCIPANLKLIHVQTKSYAKHMALDDAFDDLNEALDAFYECVQGYYVLKTGSRLPLSPKRFTFEEPDDSDVISSVKKMKEVFTTAADAVTDGDSALESVRDNVINAFQQLAYRLTLK